MDANDDGINAASFFGYTIIIATTIAPKSTAGAALNLSFGEATGIDGVAADAEKNVKVYNVNGQYVGTSLDALPKGLYIVGGKKVLK